MGLGPSAFWARSSNSVLTLIFHDFGMIILVLVQATNSLKAKVVKIFFFDGFVERCSTSITVGILEETNKITHFNFKLNIAPHP